MTESVHDASEFLPLPNCRMTDVVLYTCREINVHSAPRTVVEGSQFVLQSEHPDHARCKIRIAQIYG